MLKRLWLHLRARILEERANRSLRRAAGNIRDHARDIEAADKFVRRIKGVR